MKGNARWIILLGFAVFLSACGTLKAVEPGPYRVATPIVREAWVEGPRIVGRRASGYSSSYIGATTAAAVATSGASGAAITSMSGAASSISFEYYTTDAVEQLLRKVLEDTRTLRKVHRAAEVEIRGFGGHVDDPIGVHDIWTFLNLFTAWLGVPLYDRYLSTVELRVYDEDGFVASYVGKGKCREIGTIYYIFYHRGRGTQGACAIANAVGNAVLRLQESPPDWQENDPGEERPEPARQ